MINADTKVCQYTIGVDTDTPVMFIDTHIGFDEEDGQGIDGAAFAKELMELDLLDKKNIDIWICSTGGSIVEAQKIYSAILNTKTKVNTYNMGVCLSVAASLFQAGRKRYMADYAMLMLHPVHNSQSQKALDSFTDSVVTMLSRRTNKNEADIKQMMYQTTWLNAVDCLELGLCDEVINSSDINKPRLIQNASNDYKVALQFMNNAKEILTNTNKITMKKVANHFKLNADSNEDAIFEAVIANENKLKAEVEAAQNVLKLETEKSNQLKNDFDALQNKFNALEKEATERTEKENAEKAANMVAEAVKAGKIADTDEAKNKWIDLAKLQPEGTKALLDTLATNKVGKSLVVETASNVKTAGDGSQMAAAMAAINNKAKA